MSLNLPFISKKSKSSATEVVVDAFLGLVFSENGIRAAFWQVDGNQVVIKQQSAFYTFTNDDEAIIATDDALKELGKESEAVNEVVFGFDPKWVNDNGLVKEKRPFIKKLTENLSLKPVGFVVLTDAIIQDIFFREKTVSQILIYIQEAALSLILLKKGKVAQQISVGRSDDVVADIVEGLARFDKDKTDDGSYLPAKMVLASLVLTDLDLQDIRTKIINYDWADNHPFVQSPLIEKIMADRVLEIVIKQGGLAVAESRGLKLDDVDESILEKGKVDSSDSVDFGFSDVDTDLAGDNFTSVGSSEQKAEATSFGIPISQEELPKERDNHLVKKPLVSTNNQTATKFTNRKSGPMNKLLHWYHHHPHKKMILGGAVSGFLASIALLVGGLVFAYKVEVSVELTERVIAKEVELKVDTTVATSNVENLTLRGELEVEEYNGTKVTDTTGVKLVGEKAKGKITILNKTTSPKTFTAGTVFSSGSLNFTLDEEVTVASAEVTQSGTSETKDYGKLDTQVTAAKIGAESNLAVERELTVANYDQGTYSALVKETFTGGSSREVRVISQEDKTLVLNDLKKELFKKAQEDYANKSGDGVYYVLSGKQVVVEADYGGELGEEADQLALELTMEFEAVRYSSEDIKPLAVEILKADLPAGYEFTDDAPEILTAPREEATSSSQIILEANVSAKALPKFDPSNLTSALRGIPLEAVSSKATERPEIRSASYSVKPSLAKMFVSTVPKADHRIIINILQEKTSE